MKPRALIRAASVTIAWIAFATIFSEISSSFKSLLSLIGGHHWIGKSVLSPVFFVLLLLVFSKYSDDEFSLKDIWWLIGTVVLSGLAILIFYVQHL